MMFTNHLMLLPTCAFFFQVICKLEVYEGDRGPVPGSSEGV